MPLDKPGLKASIKSIFEDLATRENDPAQAREDLSEALANAIDVYVKTGTVNVTVATTGTATAQSGTGTGGIN